MKRNLIFFLIIFFFFTGFLAHAEVLSNKKWNVVIAGSGNITHMSYWRGSVWDTIPFASGKWEGPVLFLNNQPVVWQPQQGAICAFKIVNDTLDCSLRYVLQDESLLLKLSLKNKTNRALKPEKISVKMGVDAYMKSYPQWNKKHFPTLLRCEETHFWGYSMSPEGSILGVVSPQPVASWSIDYASHHRLGSYNIDLLNSIPQPARHPEELTELKSGEEKNWDIYLVPINELEQVKPVLATYSQAPMIEATGDYTIAQEEIAELRIYGNRGCEVAVISPSGKNVKVFGGGNNKLYGDYWFKPNKNEYGVYALSAVNKEGKRSEAMFYVRKPWSWYLQKARVATIEAPPLKAPHAEWFYNAYTAYLAARFVPDSELDSITNRDFRAVLAAMYDVEKQIPLIKLPDYILQWYYSLVGIMTRIYQVTQNPADLQIAADLADKVIEKGQKSDGAFRNEHGTHYTCVIYVVKPLLELAAEEKKLGTADVRWKERAERHMLSARRAAEDLLLRLDDIETEGEQTFEDGMISCSALQLGYMGLQSGDESLRKQYTDALEYMLRKHRCLEVLQAPDCRMIGGTFRFWEAYHDLRITPYMMNTPHGWGSWKTHATYYAYLLTGKEEWLRQTMDAVGSAMQMIDLESGRLRWGFVPNPYIKAVSLVKEDPVIVGTGTYENRLIGEQYLEMKRYWRTKQSSDNDVHEHFKMMAEVALTNAFVLQREDGSLLTYNCKVVHKGKKLYIQPYEKTVTAIHFNLCDSQTVVVEHNKKRVEEKISKGMNWLEIYFLE